MTRFKTDEGDLAAAVKLLDSASNVETWSITKITNGQHSLWPYGCGFGVSVWDGRGQVFEKSGAERSVLAAAQDAVKRLGARLANS